MAFCSQFRSDETGPEFGLTFRNVYPNLAGATMGAPPPTGPYRGAPSPERTVTGDNPKVITVFVRKGADNLERWLSFHRPSDISADELLQLGLALDGNQALLALRGVKVSHDGEKFLTVYRGPFIPKDEEDPESLPEGLAKLEKGLAAWLRSKGYLVSFA